MIEAQNPALPSIYFTYKSQLPNRESNKLPQSVKSCFLRRSNSQQEMDKFDLGNIIIRSTLTGRNCSLCQTRYKPEEMGSVGECQHQFCKRCLHDYLIYKISVMEEVTCPQEDCNATIDTHASCYQELPEQYKKRYTRFLLWKQTISNPSIRLCPIQQCTGIIDTRESFICKTCRAQFCGECMLAKHEGPCDTNFQRNFKEWKRCPTCRMFIEKTEGCNHMTCLCGHQFCFVCLANWEEQHYQCGSATDILQGGVFHQYRFAEDQPRWQQIIFGIIMIILTPIFLVLAVAVLLICVGGAAVLGALVGPCVVGSNTITNECCGVWFIIFVVTMPIIMTVCALGAAARILYESVRVMQNVVESYFSTILFLFCPPQEDEEIDIGLEQLIQ